MDQDGNMVDVHEANQGKQCNCVCPSCKTPLIARQGEKREWHFAHDSKGVFEKTEAKCEHSALVSIASMAKQLFKTCNSTSTFVELTLPDYVIQTDGMEVPVTRERKVKIFHCDVEEKIYGISADILTEVEGYPLAFYLVHAGRSLPVREADFYGMRIGVVVIDVSSIPILVHDVPETGEIGKYREALKRGLFEQLSGKKWIYHPRTRKMMERTKERRKSGYISSTTNTEHFGFPSTVSGVVDRWHLARYECRTCRVCWEGPTNVCFNCHDYLYSSRIEDNV